MSKNSIFWNAKKIACGGFSCHRYHNVTKFCPHCKKLNPCFKLLLQWGLLALF